MNLPEWTKPALYGALAGGIAISIFGFSWAGWTTDSNAKKMAQTFANQEVTSAMVPVCLSASAADPDRDAKLTTLTEVKSFQRSKAMMDTGWATLPGADKPSRELATACIAGLKLDGS